MPEPETTIPRLPEVLRRRLSVFEQNVLRFAADGGPDLVYSNLNTKTKEAAVEVIERTKEKAARILGDELAEKKSNGSNGTAPAREEWPHTDAAVRRQLPPPDAESQREVAAAKRRRDCFRDRDSILPPEHEEMEEETLPRRRQDELKDEALRILDDGPMRQAELAKALGLDAPQMSILKRRLGDAIEEGERVNRSPILSLRGAAEDEDRSEDRSDDRENDRDSAHESAHESAQMDASVDTPDPANTESATRAEPGKAERLDDGELREVGPEAEDLTAARKLVETIRRAGDLAAAVDVALPDELLKARYLAALLRRIEEGDTSADLLDRFERLAGLAGVGAD